MGGIVIIGAGLAGLFTALKLAPMRVTVIAGAPLGEVTSLNVSVATGILIATLSRP